jgi:polysaccharide deacetylase 2 family uncharacterized protein YibQ
VARSKKKKKEGLTFAFAAFGLTGLLSVLMIAYLATSLHKKPAPPFEEVYAASNELSREIRLVDKAISDGLCTMGVPKERITFLSVIPRQKGDYHWDFSTISVKISKGHSLSRIVREIERRISEQKIPVRIDPERKREGGLTYNIYCKGLYTHRLSIVKNGKESPGHSLSPKIGIIIDDLGYDNRLASAFMGVDLPLTLSVLPFTPKSKAIARKAAKEGRETMLHLPMEPLRYPAVNPGEGVLLVSMDKAVIRETLVRDLSEVPLVVGVNNHMGSRFTENEEKMAVVLEELHKRNLFFIDSRTTAASVAFKVAREMKMRTAKRDIFLDNDLSENALKIQMERLLSLARQKGHAIGIGHPHKETLEFLKTQQMTFNAHAEVVPVSRLLQ